MYITNTYFYFRSGVMSRMKLILHNPFPALDRDGHETILGPLKIRIIHSMPMNSWRFDADTNEGTAGGEGRLSHPPSVSQSIKIESNRKSVPDRGTDRFSLLSALK